MSPTTLLLRHIRRCARSSQWVPWAALCHRLTAQGTIQLGRKHWAELSLPEHSRAQNESACHACSLLSQVLLRKGREFTLLQTCLAPRAVQGGSMQPSPDGAAAFSLARSRFLEEKTQLGMFLHCMDVWRVGRVGSDFMSLLSSLWEQDIWALAGVQNRGVFRCCLRWSVPDWFEWINKIN